MTIKISHHSSIHDIPPSQWDGCNHEHPLTSHAWLAALEDSHSITAEKGWQPFHITLQDNKTIIACAPIYIKSHSRGEFIFDDNWAHAIEHQTGRNYYPKLFCGIPVTPSASSRFLLRDSHDKSLIPTILAHCKNFVANHPILSSFHIAFPHPEEIDPLQRAGFALKNHCQFHWHNHDFGSFDDFLATLRSHRRKQIRKERKRISETVAIRQLHGDELKSQDWDEIYQFYRNTTDNKWGGAYLTRSFFSIIGKTMGRSLIIYCAYDKKHDKKTDAPLAMALHIKGKDALYGRYWGCRADDRAIPYLHFELCYYRGIEYAIEQGLALVEAGAQGEHKLLRGYEPTTLYSAHYFSDEMIHKAVHHSLQGAKASSEHIQQRLAQYLPQKRAGD